MAAQPILERVPQGELIGLDRLAPEWTHAVVLCADDRWHHAKIIAWCRYRRGWAVLVRWPDGQEDWRRYDPRWIQKSVEHLGDWELA